MASMTWRTMAILGAMGSMGLAACGAVPDGSGTGAAGPSGELPTASGDPQPDWTGGSSADAGVWDESAAGGTSAGTAGPAMPPSAAAPDQSGEQYQDYGANPFVDTATDPFSTFAIDVDTASYTLMRRDVNASVLPVPASVRVEEYVNFFHYNDAPPAADDAFPFAIHLEAAPSPFGAGLELLRVNLTGRTIATDDLKPVNLVFLVDVSGSMMEPNKLGLVKETLTTLVRQLRPTDTIAIVTYAGAEGLALPATPVSERGQILSVLDSLEAGGSTNGQAGLALAYDVAAHAFRQGGVNRVVLCTDGDFNVGVTGDALVQLIEAKRDEGITLSALGFGSDNYNDATMEQLADRGNGNYAYVDSAEEADRVARRDLTGMLEVIAKDAKIQVELNPAVVVQYRLIGYENRAVADRDFVNDRVDGGEIGSGHQVTAFLELKLAEGVEQADAASALATVRVRAKTPDGVESHETSKAIALADRLDSVDAASADLRFGAAVAETAEILRGSPHVDAQAPFAAVQALARGAANQGADRLEFVALLGIIAGLLPAR